MRIKRKISNKALHFVVKEKRNENRKNEKPDVGWRQHKKKKLTRLLRWWFLLASQIHSPQSHNPVCVDSTSLLKLHFWIKIIIQICGTRMTASDLKWFSIVILLMELTWYWVDKPRWARSFIAVGWYVRRIICILLICVDMYVVYSYSRSRSGDIVLCFLIFCLRERYKEVKSCLLRLIAPDPFIGGGWYLRSSFDCCLPSRANVIIVTCSDLSEIIFRLIDVGNLFFINRVIGAIRFLLLSKNTICRCNV